MTNNLTIMKIPIGLYKSISCSSSLIRPSACFSVDFVSNRLVETIPPLFNAAHQSSEDLLTIGYLRFCFAFYCVFDLLNILLSLLDHQLNFRLYLSQLGRLHFIFLLERNRWGRRWDLWSVTLQNWHTPTGSVWQKSSRSSVFLTHPLFQTVHRLDHHRELLLVKHKAALLLVRTF